MIAPAAQGRRPADITRQKKWHDRFQELIAYRAAGNPWPRSTPAVTGQERELGIWPLPVPPRKGAVARGRTARLDHRPETLHTPQRH